MIGTILGIVTLANPSSSVGFSESASMIRKKMEEEQTRLQQSCAWGGTSQELLTSILSIEKECRLPGWDGYDALPVSEGSVSHSIALSKSLPWGFYKPSVGIEPDGQLTFEWYKTPRKACSVSVDPDGILHFAALNGTNQVFGSGPLQGELPSNIINAIREIFS